MKKGAFAWLKGQRIAMAVPVMLEQWSKGKPPPWGQRRLVAEAVR